MVNLKLKIHILFQCCTLLHRIAEEKKTHPLIYEDQKEGNVLITYQ
jgi:hypothetical protein